jgi:hypothetical protein
VCDGGSWLQATRSSAAKLGGRCLDDDFVAGAVLVSVVVIVIICQVDLLQSPTHSFVQGNPRFQGLDASDCVGRSAQGSLDVAIHP